MNGLGGIISMFANLVSFQVVRNLSQQIERSNAGERDHHQGFLGKLVQRMTGVPPAAAFGERVGMISPQNQKRLEKALSNHSAATAAHQAVAERHAAASKELSDEQANPTGKDLTKLQLAVIDLEEEFQKAAEKLKRATDENLSVRAEINKSMDWKDLINQRVTDSGSSLHTAMAKHEAVKNDPSSSMTDIADAAKAMQAAADAHLKVKREADKQLPPEKRERFSWANPLGSLQKVFSKPFQPNPSKPVRQRLTESVAAMHSTSDSHEAATKELADEQANPTGKDLTQLANAVAKFKTELEKATEAHKKARVDANRQGTRQEERHKATQRFSLTHPIQSLKNLWRAQKVHRKRQGRLHAERSRTSVHGWNVAHREARSRLRGAKAAFAKGPTWMNRAKVVGAGARVAGTAAGRVGAMGLARGGAMLAGAAGGPIGLAIGAAVGGVVLAISAVKAWTDRQLAKAEQVIQSQIAPKAKYSGMVANAMNRYEIQQRQLDIKNAGATQGTSSAVVESTMRLKDARSDKENRWENIGNKIIVILNDMATRATEVINAIDIVTPAVEALLGLLQLVGLVRNLSDDGKRVNNPTITMFQGMANRNNQWLHRGEQPAVPDVKRPK